MRPSARVGPTRRFCTSTDTQREVIQICAGHGLLGEEAGLGGESCGGSSGGFAAGDAEDGESDEGGAGNEDAVGGEVC